MFKSLNIALLALATLAPTAYAAAPAGMQIRYVSGNGTGCPPGTAFIDVSPDKQVFTAIFSAFTASIGPGIYPTERNKACTLVASISVPAGYQYSIFKAKYDGWFDLEPGVSLRQTSKYWFQGNSPLNYTSMYNGPRTGTFNYTDVMAVDSWSPCGGSRNMVINANLALSNARNPNGTGVAGIDSIEGSTKLMYSYYVRYRQCR